MEKLGGPPAAQQVAVFARFCRIVEAADHRRQHMAAVGVEVVTRPVEVGRHGTYVGQTVLPPDGTHVGDARQFGHGVALVGRSELPTRQRGLEMGCGATG